MDLVPSVQGVLRTGTPNTVQNVVRRIKVPGEDLDPGRQNISQPCASARTCTPSARPKIGKKLLRALRGIIMGILMISEVKFRACTRMQSSRDAKFIMKLLRVHDVSCRV